MNRRQNAYNQWLENTIQAKDVEIANSCEDICFICKTPGNLLLCDGPCKRAFHFRCLKIRKADVEGIDWFCDDCLHNRPLDQSIYIKLKKEGVSLLYGDTLELYNFLYELAHTLFESEHPSVYNGVQLVMILSEISHSASYPLCSSVFHLLHYCIDRLSPELKKPIEINDFSGFQNCLDLLQLLVVMEKLGIPNNYKKELVSIMPAFSSFQRIIFQFILSSDSFQKQSSFLRILLLSCYLLYQLGLSSMISLDQVIDLSLCCINKEIMHLQSKVLIEENSISSLLRLMQTFLMVLTYDGELLLNCSLFPYFQEFLLHQSVLSLLDSKDVRILTWYYSCVRYLSFHNEDLLLHTYSMNTTFLIHFIQKCKDTEIPLGCNCVRVLFPRDYLSGYGPYPTTAYSIINKYNHYKNETPTSIKMFPLSLIYNLHGLYLTDHTFQNGTIINNSALTCKSRVSALLDYSRGKLDLSFTAVNRGNVNLISEVSHSSVFKKRNRSGITVPSNLENTKEEEEDSILRSKVNRKVSKMKFINGIEVTFFEEFVKNDEKLMRLYETFKGTEGFPALRVDGREFDSFLLLKIILKNGGHSQVHDFHWPVLLQYLGFNNTDKRYIDMFKRYYHSEFVPFEK